MNAIADGVWPTMVTPYTDSGRIDYNALEAMLDWYLERGVDGLFAVCQSSEMFYLSLEERVELAGFVKRGVGGRIPVIASGHIADTEDGQAEEIERIAATGIDAFVLVTNRFAAQEEPDSVWIGRAERLLQRLPGIPLGLYECPYPYKRLLSPEVLEWCALTGRFSFLKDTSCSLDEMRGKLETVGGSGLKLFNANSTTLLGSLRLGAAGFSGVMGNFHPELYAWLVGNWEKEPERAEWVQAFLSLASLAENHPYPVNAKYHLQQEGIPISLNSRSRDARSLTTAQRMEVDNIRFLAELIKEHWGLE